MELVQIFIEPTEKTPLIILNTNAPKFEFIGVSIPENGNLFYAPIIDWFAEYAKKPLPHTKVVLNLEYFNISSSKMILFIFYKLMEIQSAGNSVQIDWFYADEDLHEAGTDYEYITKLNFKFKKVSRKKLAD